MLIFISCSTELVAVKFSTELVAVNYIERGDKIDENVQREIINHRSLRHPNIVRFKEVILTPTHLAIVMEYASGGELFERICNAGRFSEDEARFFFQQLISCVGYCHAMQICHCDLKLENTLLDGSPTPRLKICDFGYSKADYSKRSDLDSSCILRYIEEDLDEDDCLGKELDSSWAVLQIPSLPTASGLHWPKNFQSQPDVARFVLDIFNSAIQNVYHTGTKQQHWQL